MSNGSYATAPTSDVLIEVDMSWPRVVVTGDVDEAEIEENLPDGWTVGDNWHNGVELEGGRRSYPLVRTNRYENESDGEIWAGFVGDQSVREFVDCGGVPEEYVRDAQTCEGLTDEERETVAAALTRYVERAS